MHKGPKTKATTKIGVSSIGIGAKTNGLKSINREDNLIQLFKMALYEGRPDCGRGQRGSIGFPS